MLPRTPGTTLLAQARHAVGGRETLKGGLDGEPILEEYLFMRGVKLADVVAQGHFL